MSSYAFITGATSGIGLASAKALAAKGYGLALAARNKEKLEEVKKEIEGAMAVPVACFELDVRDADAIRKVSSRCLSELGAPRILLNDAGLARGLEPYGETKEEDILQMIDTNIKGLLTMTRLVVPGMVQRNHGHIINVGSVAGDAAYAGGNVYCATKAAVKALSDGLRIDVANTAIRVTNLKPGLVETNFSNIRFHGDTERAANVYKGVKPLTGDDIADVAVYAANAPAHVQIAEVLILATHQASGSVIVRK